MEFGNREPLFAVAPFSRKFTVMDPFMSQNTISMIFFSGSLNFSLPESQCDSTVFLAHVHRGKFTFCKHFLTKTCFFSIHITHSSVNFTWFTFLNQYKYFCKNKTIFVINRFQNNAEFAFMEKNSKKETFCFFQKNSLLLNE